MASSGGASQDLTLKSYLQLIGDGGAGKFMRWFESHLHGSEFSLGVNTLGIGK